MSTHDALCLWVRCVQAFVKSRSLTIAGLKKATGLNDTTARRYVAAMHRGGLVAPSGTARTEGLAGGQRSIVWEWRA